MAELWQSEYLRKHRISKKRTLELKYLCAQYDENRSRLDLMNAGDYSREMPALTVMLASGTRADRAKATLKKRMQDRVNAIENAALAADEMLAFAIIEAACRGRRWDEIRPPCGERQFYELRGRFYVELDARL